MTDYIGIPDEQIKKILESEYVKEFVKGTLEDIAGKKTLFDTHMEMGFGEDCYYKTKKDLIKDAVYQFIWEDDEFIKIFVSDLIEKVQEEVKWEITNIKELMDHIDGTKIQISIELESFFRDIRIWMYRYMDQLSDEEVEKLIKKYEE